MAQATKRSEPSTPADWPFKGPPVLLGDERFKLSLLSLTGGPAVPLDDLATDFNWEDQSSEMTGTVNLTDDAMSLRVVAGQRLSATWAATESEPFRPLWTLRAEAPEVAEPAKTISIPLNSGLSQANKGTDSYSFRKSRSHPHGWACDEVARAVGARTHLPIGKLAQGTHKITNLVKHSAKPLDVIVAAYQAERRATGRLFFVYWDGRLNVVPLRPSADLLQFAGVIIQASLKVALRSDFATAVTVRATTKGKQRTTKLGHKTTVKRSSKKITVKVQSPEAIRRFGYVHRELTAPDAHTEAEAKAYGERWLAKAVNPEKTFTVTIPIMPQIRRGDAFTVNWKSQGLTQVCYVAGVTHSYAPGSATTQITATFTSPFTDAKAKADAEDRAAKAKQAGRPSSDTGGTAAPSGQQAKRRS